MKIILFDLADIDYRGGCEKFFANLAKTASVDNDVFTIGSRGYNAFMRVVYSIISWRKIEKIQYLTRDIGTTKRIDLRLKDLVPLTKDFRKIKSLLGDADVIYTKNEFQELLVLYYFLGKKEFARKVVIVAHSAIFIPEVVKGLWKVIHNLQYNSIFYAYFLKLAKKIHVPNSDYISLIASTYKISKSKISCIPYPIDWDTKLYKTNNKKFTIVWLGRLTVQKGLDKLADILKSIKKEHEFAPIEFVIAGEGALKDEVIALTKEYPNVSYVGFLENVENVYKRADLVLVTSYFETFGYCVLEPCSFGIPVVSSNIAGPRDIITNGNNGYLSDTTGDFVKAIMLLYHLWKSNPNQYAKIRQKIYKESQKAFDKQVIMGKMIDLMCS